MIESMKWFDWQFFGKPPVGTFPVIVERLRGTPDRIDAKIKGLAKEHLTNG